MQAVEKAIRGKSARAACGRHGGRVLGWEKGDYC